MQPEDTIRFLMRDGFNVYCPVCNGEDWTVHTPPPDHPTDETLKSYMIGVADVSIEKRVIKVRSGGMPLVPVCCENCGYTRFHRLDIIKSWVDSQKDEDTSSAEQEEK